jgi:hypothetical protein
MVEIDGIKFEVSQAVAGGIKVVKIIYDEIIDIDVIAESCFVNRLHARFVGRVNGNVDRVNGNVHTVNGIVDRVNGNVDRVNGSVDTVNGSVDTVEGKVDTVEGKVSVVECGYGKE